MYILHAWLQGHLIIKSNNKIENNQVYIIHKVSIKIYKK